MLLGFLRRTGLSVEVNTYNLFCDNIAALSMVGNQAHMIWRTRHVPIRGHILYEVLDVEVSFMYVGTANQRANAMTKGLTKQLHEKAMISWTLATTP